jgi:folylpolyglutamate synthase/dihydrofolate synthase
MADVCLFVSTMLFYKSLYRFPKSSDYVSTLNKLFRPTSTASRHFDSKSTSELFKIRKRLFLEVYNDNISRDCSVIHVAGTKGKGSTVEYISSALINSGENVGVFTSPHLHTARERIKFGRRLISKEDMVHFGNISLTLMQKFTSAVFFDVLLTTALLYFGRKEVNYLVMESGIGGRYDSTNFVEAPVACVICSISLDHQGTLGETIEEIAWQKAGIIKRGSHVFTPSTQKPGVLEVFRKQCQAMEATLHVVDVDRFVVASRDLCNCLSSANKSILCA